MARLPLGKNLQCTYENFVAECPHCKWVCIFNRASDLKTFELIDGRDVSCLSPKCAKSFRIWCDLINPKHQMHVFDSEYLFEQKRYMNCILHLCQAYEMFFSQFLRVELVFKPFWNDQGYRNELNPVAELLWKQARGMTFQKLRKVFLRRVVDQIPAPANLGNSQNDIKGIKGLSETPIPDDCDIEKLGDQELIPILKMLKNTKINELRNRVIHKDAYRPTQSEAEDALSETKSILMPLTHILDIQEDINWYRRYAVKDDD